MIMSNMTATQHLEIIREKNRPTVNDYIPAIFNHFTELHGDRHYGDDAAILSGIATLNSTPVTRAETLRKTRSRISQCLIPRATERH